MVIFFLIHSTTRTTEFRLNLNVREWLEKDNGDWDFNFSSFDENMNNSEEYIGTQIEVTDLNLEIATELSSAEFEEEVIEHIQRRVGLDIAYGITIIVNGKIFSRK